MLDIGRAILPATEPMLTMHPSPRARRCGSTSWVSAMSENRFVSKFFRMASTGTSSTGPRVP